MVYEGDQEEAEEEIYGIGIGKENGTVFWFHSEKETEAPGKEK